MLHKIKSQAADMTLMRRLCLSCLQLSPLYLAAMDAIHAVSPTTVMLVEGTGQQGYPGINWGDGFVTDRSLISRYGLSDANVFFSALQSKPYLDLVGISPHVYPPSVTYATQVSAWMTVFRSDWHRLSAALQQMWPYCMAQPAVASHVLHPSAAPDTLGGHVCRATMPTMACMTGCGHLLAT